jgi:hypothetical protein
MPESHKAMSRPRTCTAKGAPFLSSPELMSAKCSFSERQPEALKLVITQLIVGTQKFLLQIPTVNIQVHRDMPEKAF